MPFVFFTLFTSPDHFSFGYWFSSFNKVLGVFSLYFNNFFWPSFCLPILGFPGGSALKNSPANAEETGSIPRLEKSPGGGNGNPLQYSFLGNPKDRGDWWAYRPWGVKKESDVTKRLKQQHYLFTVLSHGCICIFIVTSRKAFTTPRSQGNLQCFLLILL